MAAGTAVRNEEWAAGRRATMSRICLFSSKSISPSRARFLVPREK